jgi:hypothetical protein
MGAVDELGSRGLIDWSRAVVDGRTLQYGTVTGAISCGGYRAELERDAGGVLVLLGGVV